MPVLEHLRVRVQAELYRYQDTNACGGVKPFVNDTKYRGDTQ